MWVLSPIRPPSSCETLDCVFQYQSGRDGFDDCQNLDYFWGVFFFGSNFAFDFPVPVEFPAESSF